MTEETQGEEDFGMVVAEVREDEVGVHPVMLEANEDQLERRTETFYERTEEYVGRFGEEDVSLTEEGQQKLYNASAAADIIYTAGEKMEHPLATKLPGFLVVPSLTVGMIGGRILQEVKKGITGRPTWFDDVAEEGEEEGTEPVLYRRERRLSAAPSDMINRYSVGMTLDRPGEGYSFKGKDETGEVREFQEFEPSRTFELDMAISDYPAEKIPPVLHEYGGQERAMAEMGLVTKHARDVCREEGLDVEEAVITDDHMGNFVQYI